MYSTDDREFALVAAHSRRREWCGFQKSAFDQIALCLRTALQQPPRLAAIARGKLSSRVCPKSNLPAPSGGLQLSPGGLARISLVQDRWDTSASPREISTQNHNTHIAMGHDPTIAWKASPTRTPPPICTFAPFLKPRWSQDRGRREQGSNYTMGDFSQSPDFTRAESLGECCNAAVVCPESKFLNHRKESRVS